MALKFLNKKGWHTGSLRNIENVWKAEQKHEAEQKKLEELRKQIQEERERSEFRLLQEQAGLVPKQERLDFLYESGLAVGRAGTSDGGGGGGFKALEEALPTSKSTDNDSAKQSTVPGALFEEKPHSANDAWRKLHSDPLLLIRQREQEARARIKNNPVQMALIRKSVEEKKQKEKSSDAKERHKKHSRNDISKSEKQSTSEDNISKEVKRREHGDNKRSNYDRRYHRSPQGSDDESSDSQYEKKSRSKGKHINDDQDAIRRNHDKLKHESYYSKGGKSLDADKNGGEDRLYDSSVTRSRHESHHNHRSQRGLEDESSETQYQKKSQSKGKCIDDDQDATRRNHDKPKHERYYSKGGKSLDTDKIGEDRVTDSSVTRSRHELHHNRRNVAPKLSEEDRAARLREMQENAELHEEQRWKRLKKADENDAREAARGSTSGARNFLDAAHRSIYGAEKGGSATIEVSVRRRAHYSQGRSESESNAFRR